jgi:hypothetical protein
MILLGLQFVDNADADPGTGGLDVLTKHEHFIIDYSKGNGQESVYKAYTVDKFRYPDDPRLHNEDHLAASVFVRRIEGKRFLYLTGMYAKQLSVYRMKGETEGVTRKLKLGVAELRYDTGSLPLAVQVE